MDNTLTTVGALTETELDMQLYKKCLNVLTTHKLILDTYRHLESHRVVHDRMKTIPKDKLTDKDLTVYQRAIRRIVGYLGYTVPKDIKIDDAIGYTSTYVEYLDKITLDIINKTYNDVNDMCKYTALGDIANIVDWMSTVKTWANTQLALLNTHDIRPVYDCAVLNKHIKDNGVIFKHTSVLRNHKTITKIIEAYIENMFKFNSENNPAPLLYSHLEEGRQQFAKTELNILDEALSDTVLPSSVHTVRSTSSCLALPSNKSSRVVINRVASLNVQDDKYDISYVATKVTKRIKKLVPEDKPLDSNAIRMCLTAMVSTVNNVELELSRYAYRVNDNLLLPAHPLVLENHPRSVFDTLTYFTSELPVYYCMAINDTIIKKAMELLELKTFLTGLLQPDSGEVECEIL